MKKELSTLDQYLIDSDWGKRAVIQSVQAHRKLRK
ncbi:hypothetical protein DTPHA_1404429 [Enterococcus faecium]|nr:hypothetical protein DTPHA_1404429 [Enterococcus faecium]